jgi:transposase
MPVRPGRENNGGQAEQALAPKGYPSRGGFTTKIHVTVDGLGNPLRLRLTAGQRNDILLANEMIAGLDFDYVTADRGYCSHDFRSHILDNGAQPVIPPKKNARNSHDYDAWLYRERHLIECFMGKIKHFRRVFSRFDKLARPYLSFLHLSSTLIWLR